MAKKPARSRWAYFSFFPEDFWGGTIGWTSTQQIAYLKLICACHASEDGAIPGDNQSYLARAAEVDRRHWYSRIRNAVLTKFRQLPDGRIFNPRVIADRKAIGRAVVDISRATRIIGKFRTEGVPSKGVPSRRHTFKSKSANEINDAAPHHAPKTGETRARLPNPKDPPLPPLPVTAPSPGDLTAAQAPADKAQKPKLPQPALPANSLSPPKPKPINAAKLSDEERAKLEQDTNAWIREQQAKQPP